MDCGLDGRIAHELHLHIHTDQGFWTVLVSLAWRACQTGHVVVESIESLKVNEGDRIPPYHTTTDCPSHAVYKVNSVLNTGTRWNWNQRGLSSGGSKTEGWRTESPNVWFSETAFTPLMAEERGCSLNTDIMCTDFTWFLHLELFFFFSFFHRNFLSFDWALWLSWRFGGLAGGTLQPVSSWKKTCLQRPWIHNHINPMWAHWQRRVCWNFAGPGNDAWNQETTGFGLRCFFEILLKHDENSMRHHFLLNFFQSFWIFVKFLYF